MTTAPPTSGGKAPAAPRISSKSAAELSATRLLVYDLAARVDASPGVLFPREASMCKLKATELAKRMTLEGMQMMGGAGYAVEYDMERQVRVALVRATKIAPNAARGKSSAKSSARRGIPSFSRRRMIRTRAAPPMSKLAMMPETLTKSRYSLGPNSASVSSTLPSR